MLRTLATAALVALMVTAPLARAQQPQETVRETHGDWEIRCAQGGACVMAQVGKGVEGNDVIEVRVRKLDGVTGQQGEPVPAAIQILAPLGVLLPAGLRVQVDSQQVRAAPFEVCGPGGCIVRQAMSEDFLAEMKAGGTANVTLVAAPNTEVNVDISLRGFTAAFGSL